MQNKKLKSGDHVSAVFNNLCLASIKPEGEGEGEGGTDLEKYQ